MAGEEPFDWQSPRVDWQGGGRVNQSFLRDQHLIYEQRD